jgi:hypothetical protein
VVSAGGCLLLIAFSSAPCCAEFSFEQHPTNLFAAVVLHLVSATVFYYYLGWDATYGDLMIPENQFQDMKYPRGMFHPR